MRKRAMLLIQSSRAVLLRAQVVSRDRIETDDFYVTPTFFVIAYLIEIGDDCVCLSRHIVLVVMCLENDAFCLIFSTPNLNLTQILSTFCFEFRSGLRPSVYSHLGVIYSCYCYQFSVFWYCSCSIGRPISLVSHHLKVGFSLYLFYKTVEQ